MVIGICDDVSTERELLLEMCKQCIVASNVSVSYEMFSNGPEILNYCSDEHKPRIDLLFLDIELGKMSGISLKDNVTSIQKIWRIVFVSNYTKDILDTYSIKTIGFVQKPPTLDKIRKYINSVINEINQNVVLYLPGYNKNTFKIMLEDVLFLKASGSYTEIYTRSLLHSTPGYVISSKKLGEIQEDITSLPIARVHKSYMVNLDYIAQIGCTITLQYTNMEIPIGRTYRDNIKRQYYQYGKDKIYQRL